MKRVALSPFILLVFSLLVGCQSLLKGPDVKLTTNGKTDHVIVKPESPSPIDDYAVKELAHYLKLITGADFAVVDPAELPETGKFIFVGVSEPMRERLGNNDPRDDLDNQEFAVRSVGEDVFLYGEGVHGNLNAMMNFLEESLGWRWYTIFEPPTLPDTPTVTLKPFNRRGGFDFLHRKVDLQRGMDFYYQHGMNMGFDQRVKLLARKVDPKCKEKFACFVNETPESEVTGHSLFTYVPPNAKARGANRFDWTRKDYFADHPEYFSLWENGKRFDKRQLCFGNPELRGELTKNLLRHVEIEGDDSVVTVDAMDEPGKFCHCPKCAELEKKYQSPGGPLYDYLIELCDKLKTTHPNVLVKSLAYRRSQTQIPPVLPNGGKLPDNLIVDFAPIEDCYLADWTHPDEKIQETLSHLRAWAEITRDGNLWAWLYPNGWGSGYAMPVGTIDRLINNMRIMRDAGVKGVKTDQMGYHQRANCSELQAYLLYKLCQNADVDTDAVIKEFTDHMYGSAAELMRTYLRELEEGRKSIDELPPNVRSSSPSCDERTFPYLTVENIHHWQGYFDQMEKLLENAPKRQRNNVRFVRRELDLATLWKWFDLKKAYPDVYKDHQVFVDRVNAVNAIGAEPTPKWEGKDLNRKPNPGPSPDHFDTLIKAGGQTKPLPAAFNDIDPSRIRQFVPKMRPRPVKKRIILDPDAAFGYAVPVFRPDLPLQFGFYQGSTKRHCARRAIEKQEIKPGEYQLFKLGEIHVTPDCQIWFSARSWATNLQLGEQLFEADGDNLWDAYASIKFLGPSHGDVMGEETLPAAERDYLGMNPKDLVLVDRIILVEKNDDHAKTR